MAALRRSATNSKLFGVCGGLAEHFGVDATLVRAAFIMFALMGGPGILAYILLTLVVPAPLALPHRTQWQLPGR